MSAGIERSGAHARKLADADACVSVRDHQNADTQKTRNRGDDGELRGGAPPDLAADSQRCHRWGRRGDFTRQRDVHRLLLAPQQEPVELVCQIDVIQDHARDTRKQAETGCDQHESQEQHGIPPLPVGDQARLRRVRSAGAPLACRGVSCPTIDAHPACGPSARASSWSGRTARPIRARAPIPAPR